MASKSSLPMAATAANITHLLQEDDHDQNRHKPSFHPTIWGDFFLHYKPCTPSHLLSMKNKAEVKREEVRKLILDSGSADLTIKLELVITLQRLGLDYHYRKEIDDLMRGIHHDDDGEGYDLHTTALRFYLLRKQGYYVSPDVFLKFTDGEGNIACVDNTESMLCMYNAAHLKIRGEEILDKAILFTKKYLQFIVEQLQSPELKEEVRYALEAPLFRRPRTVEAIHFISVYEKTSRRNETILEFAKLDFSILQALYCEELRTLTLWWKELQLNDHLSFVRDRMVEMHFWMLQHLFEPRHSYGRIMLTKLVTLFSIADDIYDSYSTLEESKLFTKAMERWDEQAADQLPEYMKFFYKKVLTTVDAIEQDLILQGNKNADYVKKILIDATRSYYNEVKWHSEKGVAVPAKTVEEHLRFSVPSSVCMHIECLAFVAMGDVVSRDAMEWGMTYPKIIRACCLFGRLSNDIVSHEREQEEQTGHLTSTVEACMEENKIGKEEAYEKLRQMLEECWLDINEERMCIITTPAVQQAAPLLETVVNGTRVQDFVYKHHDAYTVSHSLKATLHSLYVATTI